MKKVLYAENDINLALAVKSLLETQYMQVQHESRGRDVLENFASFNPDLLILDVMLDDDKDGFQVAEEIRKKSQVPILFISSNDESSHLRRAFNIKHTDYIRKPFTIQELQLRINRILYQGNLIQTPENHFVLGRVRFIPKEQMIIIHDREIHLTNYECAVFEALCRNLNNYMMKDQLIKDIWGTDNPKMRENSFGNVLSRLRIIVKPENNLKIKSGFSGKVRMTFEG